MKRISIIKWYHGIDGCDQLLATLNSTINEDLLKTNVRFETRMKGRKSSLKGLESEKEPIQRAEEELVVLQQWNEIQWIYSKFYENKSGATEDLKHEQLMYSVIAEDFRKTMISS